MEHTPIDLHQCYGIDFFCKFMDEYCKDSKPVQFYATLQEMGIMIKRFAKMEFKIFNE